MSETTAKFLSKRKPGKPEKETNLQNKKRPHYHPKSSGISIVRMRYAVQVLLLSGHNKHKISRKWRKKKQKNVAHGEMNEFRAADLRTAGRAVVSSSYRDVSNSCVKSLGLSSPPCRQTRSCSDSAAIFGSKV